MANPATVASWTMPSVATVSQAYRVMRDHQPVLHTAPGSSVPSQPSSLAGTAGTTVGQTAASTSAGADTLIQLINQARIQSGLAPYTVNATLMHLAQTRAQALATDGVFTSDLPTLGWPIQMEQAAGISALGMGAENIAEASSVAAAFELLMASPPHRSNILNPYETQVGVGVARLSNGVAVSELFIGPNS
ncbi:MAG: CAP domain-containing protein [Thermaerobacter sp.]|nr:CAP domain-containing protein [Thermaerobacter sp.]